MNTLIKDMTAGAQVYALIKKDDELLYHEGTVVSVGQPRVEMPTATAGFPGTVKTVVDVTYTLDGKNYTDAVSVTDSMFATDKPGAITLVAPDRDIIVRELKATRQKADDYLKNVDKEKARNEKRVEQCDTLIAKLDTTYAEKQEMENRIKKLEEGTAKTNGLLEQILKKLG